MQWVTEGVSSLLLTWDTVYDLTVLLLVLAVLIGWERGIDGETESEIEWEMWMEM